MPGSNIANSVARDAVTELTEILREWEEEHTLPAHDPTPHLIKLCDLFEHHTNNFLKRVSTKICYVI